MQALASALALGRVLAAQGFRKATPAATIRAASTSQSERAESALNEITPAA